VTALMPGSPHLAGFPDLSTTLPHPAIPLSAGFKGLTCETDCKCNGHGTCKPDNTCACDAGYKWTPDQGCVWDCPSGSCIGPGEDACSPVCQYGTCYSGACECWAGEHLGAGLAVTKVPKTRLVRMPVSCCVSSWRAMPMLPAVVQGCRPCQASRSQHHLCVHLQAAHYRPQLRLQPHPLPLLPTLQASPAPPAASPLPPPTTTPPWESTWAAGPTGAPTGCLWVRQLPKPHAALACPCIGGRSQRGSRHN